jgi:MFS family permease
VSQPGNALSAYLSTATLSRSATESAGPALLVAAIATLGSATTGSYIVASLTASAAIGGPVVGALIDRAPSPRRGFALAMVTMAAGLAAIALTLGHAPVWVIITLAVFAGLGYPALTGAWSAQLPKLIPPDRVTHAYSADAATYSVAAVIAPPIATALVFFSATAPLWMPVVLLVAGIGLLRTVPLPVRGDVPHPVSLWQDLRNGLGTIVGRPGLRRTAIITTVGFAGQAAIFVSAPILAQSVGGSLGFTGVILGVFAVGGITTAAWFTRRPVKRPDRAIIVSTILSAVALTAVGLAPTTWLLLLAAFAMGATEPPLFSAMFQVRVRESPSRVQGQVFTTSASLRMTAFALATALSGWLLHWGVGVVIAVGVLMHVVSLVIGIAMGPPLPPRGHWLRRP